MAAGVVVINIAISSAGAVVLVFSFGFYGLATALLVVADGVVGIASRRRQSRSLPAQRRGL